MKLLALIPLVALPAVALAEAPPAVLTMEDAEHKLEKVRLLAYGPGFLGARDARPLAMNELREPIAADSLVTLPAVAEGQDRVPVLLAEPSIRLIVQVPATLLATVARADAYVYASPAAAAEPDPARVRLRPGITLAPDAADGAGWRRVHYRTPDLEVAGVVRADRVGHVYPETSGFLDGGDAEVRGNTKVFASPGGPVLATLSAGRSRWLPARKLGVGRGHVRIRLTESDVAIDGWVRAADERGVPAFGTGGSWASGGESGFQRHRPGAAMIKLVKGTLLRTSPGGEIVGMILLDSGREVVRADPGKAPVIMVHTKFGDAELVAESPR